MAPSTKPARSLRFRSAAQGKGLTRKPPAHLKTRIATYFDPLPFYYEPLESHVTDKHKYPLAAVTQRPMAMYHSWDSQNAWLRQIHAHNYLFINPRTARAQPRQSFRKPPPAGRHHRCVRTWTRWVHDATFADTRVERFT